MTTAKTINIDNIEYPLDSLSDLTRTNLVNIRAVDKEIAHLKTQLAIAQTARAVFADGIKKSLPETNSAADPAAE